MVKKNKKKRNKNINKNIKTSNLTITKNEIIENYDVEPNVVTKKHEPESMTVINEITKQDTDKEAKLESNITKGANMKLDHITTESNTVIKEDSNDIELDAKNEIKEKDIEDIKENKISTNIKQNSNKITKFIIRYKETILACAITAIISSTATIMIIRYKDNINTTNSTKAIIESDKDAVQIGRKLEENLEINLDSSYSLDYTFDSRFDNFRDNIIDIYTKVRDTQGDIQEIYIIKSNDIANTESSLQQYKEKLIEIYKTKPNYEKEFKLAKKAILNSVNDITYFILSEQSSDIEKVIETELNK